MWSGDGALSLVVEIIEWNTVHRYYTTATPLERPPASRIGADNAITAMEGIASPSRGGGCLQPQKKKKKTACTPSPPWLKMVRDVTSSSIKTRDNQQTEAINFCSFHSTTRVIQTFFFRFLCVCVW